MTEANQVRINELARELEVKAKAIIDLLPGFGVTEKKTHSSSIPEDVAAKVRRAIQGQGEADVAPAPPVVEKPAPVAAKPAAPRPAPPAPPVAPHAAPPAAAKPVAPPPAAPIPIAPVATPPAAAKPLATPV